MTSVDAIGEQIKADVGSFLLDIQTRRIVDVVAFHRIDSGARDLARALKGRPLVPKILLNQLRVAIKVMRAEAPYIVGEQTKLTQMADKLEMTFDFIIGNESPDDRIAGVPRII